MGERGKNKSIGAAGAVSSGKIGGAPDEYSCGAVDRRRKLGEGEHAEVEVITVPMRELLDSARFLG